jgi:hypothetical protein
MDFDLAGDSTITSFFPVLLPLVVDFDVAGTVLLIVVLELERVRSASGRTRTHAMCLGHANHSAHSKQRLHTGSTGTGGKGDEHPGNPREFSC